MSAGTQAPDTPRRHIEILGRRAATFPDLARSEVEDELALVSAITDREASEKAFRDLVGAYRRKDFAYAETVLDLLTGRSS